MENTELCLKWVVYAAGPGQHGRIQGSANRSSPQLTRRQGYRQAHGWHGLSGDPACWAGRCSGPRGQTDVSSQTWLCWLKVASLPAAATASPSSGAWQPSWGWFGFWEQGERSHEPSCWWLRWGHSRWGSRRVLGSPCAARERPRESPGHHGPSAITLPMVGEGE